MGCLLVMAVIVNKRSARDEELRLKNKRTGIALFQISWIMAFVCLIVVNLQLRSYSAGWPPPGVQPLDWILPTVATAGLIASGFLIRRAHQAIQADNLQGFSRQWGGALILGALFVAVMVFEWLTLPPVPEATMLIFGEEGVGPISQFNAIFRVMTAFHGFHALVIGVYMNHVLQKARQGVYGSRDSWDVEAGVKLWYFVIVAWMLFYIVLYVL
jgi:heme/copper-type cytochrome/quinol oxidase subunit 3